MTGRVDILWRILKKLKKKLKLSHRTKKNVVIFQFCNMNIETDMDSILVYQLNWYNNIILSYLIVLFFCV